MAVAQRLVEPTGTASHTRQRRCDVKLKAHSRIRLMGRRKRTAVRRVAQEGGWLDPAQPLPDPVIARQFGRTPHLRVDDGTHSAQRCLQPIMIVLDDHSVGS